LAAAVVHGLLLWLAGFVVWRIVRSEKESGAEIRLMESSSAPGMVEVDAASASGEEAEPDATEALEDPVFRQAVQVSPVRTPEDALRFDLGGEEDPVSERSQPSLDFSAVVDDLGMGQREPPTGSGSAPLPQYGGWRVEGRRGRVVGFGGGRATEAAVRSALGWLKRHQSPDGYWDIDEYHDRCGSDPGFPGRCAGEGTSAYDIGVTGLALEAFLGHGDSHLSGDYRETVRKAVYWLKGQQDGDGFFGKRPKSDDSPYYMYNHAIATYALAEAYAMTEDRGLREAVQRAVDELARVQNPGMAWRYMDYGRGGKGKKAKNDTSVTGWVIMALKAASHGKGIRVPPECFEGANAFLDTVKEKEKGKVTFGYTAPGEFFHPPGYFGGRYVTTSAGMLVRQFSGRFDGLEAAAAVMMEPDGLPSWERCNLYHWYYGTLAIFQMGGDPWERWNAALKDGLLPTQITDGCAKGSWDPVGALGDNGGRVYATACGALCLEVYYRYLPLIANR
jgi:hypothetical protein